MNTSPSPQEPCALTLNNLSHAYKHAHPTLDNISLCVSKGQVCCLLGPSGCGKTTLLRTIAGLEPISSGTISLFSSLVNNGPLIAVPPEKRKIGMIFQEASLFPHLSVGNNILLAMRHIPQKKRHARLEELLIKGGISPLRDSFPHQISGGQQQRVALARALAYDPLILLMDEPFSHLDLTQREHIRDNTLHLLKQSHSTVLMVTHDPEEAMYIADTIALLTPNGTLAQFGDPHFLYYNPQSDYVAAFFGEVNSLIGHVHNHNLSSAIGNMPCPHIQNGEANLIVRPEALQLIPADISHIAPAIGQVMTARFQGRSSLIHLASITETGQPLHLHAKVPGFYLPPQGSFHHISFDRSLAFVFPRIHPS